MVEYVHLQKERGPKMFKFSKYSFSSIELKHLGIALILITIAMMSLRKGELFQVGILNFILIYFLTIGLGFLLHELGHKFVAQHYGFISEFRADFMMMFLAIFMAWFGFLFLAPGAVMIYGNVSKRQNGIISVAGPLVNLALAIIFILINFIFKPTGILLYITSLGIWVNAFLGVFNMLPIWVLDGKKVLNWNKNIYFLVLALLLFILIGAYNNLFQFL